MERADKATRDKLRDVKAALADQRDLREVFHAMFPSGLTLTPAWDETPMGAVASGGHPERRVFLRPTLNCVPVPNPASV